MAVTYAELNDPVTTVSSLLDNNWNVGDIAGTSVKPSIGDSWDLNKVNLKTNDVVIKVLNLSKKHIACVTKLQKMLIFEIDALPKLQKGGGVQLIKIKKDDYLSDVTQLNIEAGLEWSTGSKNRKLDDVEFWIGKRAQAGKKIPKFFNKNLKFDI